MIERLLALVPWYWRVAALVAFAAALSGWGYVKGYETRDRSADIFEAKVQALAEDAARRAGQIKAAQVKTEKEIRDGWKSDVARIRAHYARCVRDGTCPGSVPAAPDRAARADGPACERAAPAADPGLEERCALDAARLKRWIDFARKNNLPVGD